MIPEKDYKFIYNRVPRFCVDLLIEKEGKFFLSKRHTEPYKGLFHMPGGGVKFKETIKEAINRIAKNEIDCQVQIIKRIGIIEMLDEIVNNDARHSISVVYKVDAINPSIGEFIELRNESLFHPDHFKFITSL